MYCKSIVDESRVGVTLGKIYEVLDEIPDEGATKIKNDFEEEIWVSDDWLRNVTEAEYRK
ncbi:hypothetical protein [Cetobacterium sp.]|uniref:hypothetical protein n=1 Tax=Cetobacterium sp. TaxID=2071632 RepID=UPI003F3FEBDB